jgi:septal ring factor EnvC (AmiA/AmiB activator)
MQHQEQLLTALRSSSSQGQLYSRLLQTQHQILLREMNKMEHLAKTIAEARARREQEHSQKMAYYQQAQELLQEEARKKDALIAKLGVFGAAEERGDEGEEGEEGA